MTGDQRTKCFELLSKDTPTREIATKLRVHIVTVRRYRAKHREALTHAMAQHRPTTDPDTETGIKLDLTGDLKVFQPVFDRVFAEGTAAQQLEAVRLIRSAREEERCTSCTYKLAAARVDEVIGNYHAVCEALSRAGVRVQGAYPVADAAGGPHENESGRGGPPVGPIDHPQTQKNIEANMGVSPPGEQSAPGTRVTVSKGTLLGGAVRSMLDATKGTAESAEVAHGGPAENAAEATPFGDPKVPSEPLTFTGVPQRTTEDKRSLDAALAKITGGRT